MKTNIKKRGLKNSIAVLIVLLFLASFQLIFPKSFSLITDKIIFLTSPFYDLTKLVLKNNKTTDDLIQENEMLKKTIRDISFDYGSLINLEKENSELKSLLNYTEKNNFTFLTAKIIGQQKIDNNQFIILDQGENDGVSIGQPVVVEDGVLLGIVAYTDLNNSYIVTPKHNTVAISAKIMGKGDGVHGVVEGMAGVSVHLNLIPKEINLVKNDLVVTSGINPLIPQGLIIGTIDQISNDSSDFFMTASLNTLAQSENFNFATIIVNNNSNDKL